tara:strand:- start:75 stop:632 length:558 start_codon:yes stop_codon:yes gene_type:complete
MARGFKNMPEDIDRWVNGTLSRDIRKGAEKVVRELQEAGPLYSGKFSNSWAIETSGGSKSNPSQAEGQPQKVTAPFLSGKELWSKPEFKYNIYNVDPDAGIAIDYEQGVTGTDGNFQRQKQDPLQQESKIKRGERRKNIRGNVVEGEGNNLSTAPLDWYDNYLQGGALDKTIKLSFEEAFKKFPR